jgi:hypothetical protein
MSATAASMLHLMTRLLYMIFVCLLHKLVLVQTKQFSSGVWNNERAHPITKNSIQPGYMQHTTTSSTIFPDCLYALH